MKTRSIDIVGTGFTVLDRIYANGTSVAAEHLGGTCGNVLLSLAALHWHVAPILSLGLDEIGSRLVNEFVGAGAETRFIRRHRDRSSPILAQHLDTAAGRHSFSFTCPETQQELPRYQPIGQDDVDQALPILTACSVFYTDRLSEAIVDAMETAGRAGALVVFEPSGVNRRDLWLRAADCVSVLKFSADRLGWLVERGGLPEVPAHIVTYGEAGLEIIAGGERHWLPAPPAPIVRDTCGAGDMVTVGLIDHLMALRTSPERRLDIATLARGVEAGQRLAAENCAFAGARGLFLTRGAAYARTVLSQRT